MPQKCNCCTVGDLEGIFNRLLVKHQRGWSSFFLFCAFIAIMASSNYRRQREKLFSSLFAIPILRPGWILAKRHIPGIIMMINTEPVKFCSFKGKDKFIPCLPTKLSFLSTATSVGSMITIWPACKCHSDCLLDIVTVVVNISQHHHQCHNCHHNHHSPSSSSASSPYTSSTFLRLSSSSLSSSSSSSFNKIISILTIFINHVIFSCTLSKYTKMSSHRNVNDLKFPFQASLPGQRGGGELRGNDDLPRFCFWQLCLRTPWCCPRWQQSRYRHHNSQKSLGLETFSIAIKLW